MKTIFSLIALVILVAFSTYAQLDKGYWIGNISGLPGANGRSSSIGNISFSLNPEVMKLIGKNTALGMSIDFQFSRDKYYGNGSVTPTETFINRYTSIELGPVIRKYFGKKSVKPFVELSTGIKMSSYRGINNPYYTDHTNFDHFLKPSIGVAWWMNDKISLNLSAEYNILNFSHSYFKGFKFGIGFRFGNPTMNK